jgi:PAS domain S-box-containing protein
MTVPASSPLVLSSAQEDGFIAIHRQKIFMGLSMAGVLFLLPFSVNNFIQGRVLLGLATTTVVICLLVNAVAIYLGRQPPLPVSFIFAPSLLGLGTAMYGQGLIGILWSYASILLFHFVLTRRTANFFNATIVLTATPMAWMHLGPGTAARVAMTMLLVIIFTNLFSYIADAQQKLEITQRQRLDLLMRGTNAGTLEWDVASNTISCSARLLAMLGYPEHTSTAGWTFPQLVHPLDRDLVSENFLEQLRQPVGEGSLQHQSARDYRLLHADGQPVWVHAQALTVGGPDGSVRGYNCSFLDISERVNAQEALRLAHEQVQQQAAQLEAQNHTLREAIWVREEVERIARHDLKTPLNSIASVPRLLREAQTLNAHDEALLGMMEGAAQRVLSMVNLSLDMHSMEEGNYKLHAVPVDLAAVLRLAARDVQEHAASKGAALHMVCPAEPVWALGEQLLCHSVVASMVGAALEASPEACALTLELATNADGVCLRVHHQAGLADEQKASFFDKYANHVQGIWSARLIAQVQNGDLQLGSQAPAGLRGGTTLKLTLPASLAPAASQALTLDRLPGAPDFDLLAVADWPELAVLLVDDDDYSLLALRNLLPGSPLIISTAVNGRAALDCVEKQNPDLIFMDIEMPVMGGLEAAQRIRALQRQSGSKPCLLIALSGHDDAATRQRCLEAGFDACLVKPISRRDVLAAMAQAAGLHA